MFSIQHTWYWLLLYVAVLATLVLLKLFGLVSYSWWAITTQLWVPWLLTLLVGSVVGACRLFNPIWPEKEVRHA